MTDARHRQQGVALITAILIVVLATTAAVAMATRQQLDVKRTANIFNSDQAYLAALGGEDYARNLLDTDRKDNQIDYLEEDWAQPVVFPFEDMVLGGQMEDMQGRFNLNNLLGNNDKPDAKYLAYFQRLLEVLDLDASIADAVIDWMDQNTTVHGFNGAEDDYYMQLTPPYRAANRFMTSASELLLLADMDQEKYARLAPFVTALPRQIDQQPPYQLTSINVNTAPAAVLAALNAQLTLADGEDMVETRKDEQFTSKDDFDNRSGIKGKNLTIDVSVDVVSDYFMLNASAEFDEARSQVYSLLKHEADGVRVVMRGRGAY